MKKIRIAIENPCHENWDKMTPESQGRFCHSCEKIVIDFSQMSDSEIIQYFSTPKTEKICGRFKSEQLNPQPPLQLLHFAYILVLILGIGVSSCNSETTIGEIQMGDTIAVVDSPKEEATFSDTTVYSANNTHLTNPKVMDNKKGENPSMILGKPKVQRIETIEPVIMGECIIPYEYDDKHEMQNKNLQVPVLHHSTHLGDTTREYNSSLFTTGPYEHRLPTPYNTNISKPASTNNR